jgi:hypothetical protein
MNERDAFFDRQEMPWPLFGCGISHDARHAWDAAMNGQIATLASTAPIDVHTDERRYVPQFISSGG